MNQQEYAIKAKPFIDALAEGKKIQYSETYNIKPVWLVYDYFDFDFDQYNYRVIVPHILVNGHEVPKPIDYQLESDNTYYVPEFQSSTGVMECTWYGREIDNFRLKHGVVHLTHNAALEHFKALVDYETVE